MDFQRDSILCYTFIILSVSEKYRPVVCLENLQQVWLGKFWSFQDTLHEKSAYSELFWSVFFIMKYISVFSPNAENADQNNSEYGYFSRSDTNKMPLPH